MNPAWFIVILIPTVIKYNLRMHLSHLGGSIKPLTLNLSSSRDLRVLSSSPRWLALGLERT